jgi:hypothetical protein
MGRDLDGDEKYQRTPGQVWLLPRGVVDQNRLIFFRTILATQ